MGTLIRTGGAARSAQGWSENVRDMLAERGSRARDAIGGLRSAPPARVSNGPSAVAMLLAGLLGAALGALLMYLLDLERGAHRRNALAQQAGVALRSGREGAAERSKDVAQRMRGIRIETIRRVETTGGEESAPDSVVAERIRAELGHSVRHAGAIEVDVSDGRAILRGPVLRDELSSVLATARGVDGVRDVESELEIHEAPGAVPALQD